MSFAYGYPYPSMRGRGGGGGFQGPPFGGGGGGPPRMPWGQGRGGGGGGRGGFFGGGGGPPMGNNSWAQFDEDVDFEGGGGGPPMPGPVFGDGGAAFQHQPRPPGPPMGGGGPGAGGAGGGGFGPWHMNPADVMAWLDHQHPFVLKRIAFHAKWLLQQHGIEPEDDEGGEEEGNGQEEQPEGGAGDTSGWYNEEAIKPVPAPASATQPKQQGFAALMGGGGGQNKKGRNHAGLGWSNNAGGGGGSKNNSMQWTPNGWVVKDNSHKVTTTMRPLPEPDIIPPNGGAQHPEATADREKLKLLQNNVNMMTYELNKICKRYRIISLNRDDLSVYPEEQRSKLKTAVGCVAAAEKTLNDFRDFLKDDKYKEWNEGQRKSHEEKVKQMIGETPTGVPHKRPGQQEEGEQQQEEEGGGDNKNKEATLLQPRNPL